MRCLHVAVVVADMGILAFPKQCTGYAWDNPAQATGCMQDVKPTDTLWTVAKEATAHVKSENVEKGGLAFWSRMYADKTMFEAMGQETPSFNPPFTVSPPHLPSASCDATSGRRKPLGMSMHSACVLGRPCLTLCSRGPLL